MLEFASFFIILLAALTFSVLFGRLHLPWVLALILGGMIIGPHGLDAFEPGPAVRFMGEVGLIFLMFIAGLEIPLSKLRDKGSRISLLAFMNGFFPFLVGMGIAWLFGYGTGAILLTGVIFMSSSVALVIPAMEASGLIKKPLGTSILATTLLQDIASLIVLSMVLQSIQPTTDLPLPLFYLTLGIVFFFGRWAIKNIQHWLAKLTGGHTDRFERELRSLILILFGTVLVFETLGLHSLVAGFFTGLVLSESVTSETIKQKLHAVSYGIFIPVFFITVGMESNVAVLFQGRGALPLTAAIVLGSVGAKMLSGWLGARISGYSPPQALMFGASSIPQLSTTLAVVYTGQKLDLLDQSLTTAIIILSLVTTFVSPLLMNWLIKRYGAELSLPFLSKLKNI